MDHVFPDIPDLCKRVAPGELVPEGECPECGALCHRDGAFALCLGKTNETPIYMYGGLDGGDLPVYLPLERSWLGKSSEDGRTVLVLSFGSDRVWLAYEEEPGAAAPEGEG